MVEVPWTFTLGWTEPWRMNCRKQSCIWAPVSIDEKHPTGAFILLGERTKSFSEICACFSCRFLLAPTILLPPQKQRTNCLLRDLWPCCPGHLPSFNSSVGLEEQEGFAVSCLFEAHWHVASLVLKISNRGGQAGAGQLVLVSTLLACYVRELEMPR